MNTAYPIFPIGILAIFCYAMSLTLVGLGLVSRVNHRKFWNVLLLISFLISSLIGLLMVAKINYKLQISGYDEMVGYHVRFGIGLALLGLFHLLWHLRYYLYLFRSAESQKPLLLHVVENEMDERHLKITAFMLGSTSIVAQIVLLREFLTIFNGNELVIGLVLANWMVLTGIGAFLGKYSLRIKRAADIIYPGLLLLSVLPFLTAFLINFLKNIVFPIGAMISVFEIFFASLVLLIPFCVISGFLFTFIAKSYSALRDRNETGTVYGYESAGSMAGGLLSGLLFMFIFSSVESLLVLIVLNGFILFLINPKQTSQKMARWPLIVAITAFTSLFFHPELKIRSFVYPNQKITVSKDTPHGNIVITQRENLWSVYNNNVLLFDSENFILNEEAVHFGMVQRPDPKAVLLVSGALSEQIDELKKYQPLSIDVVEENRWLLTRMKDTLEKIQDKSIRLYVNDPVRFIRNTPKTYDIAILNLPNPSTLQSNRFYTIEFFSLLKKKLNPYAILSFGINAPANYLNNEAVELHYTLFVTLKKVFQNVIILPGEKNYFLASDSPLTYQIARAVHGKGISNRYVNPYYIDDILLENRGKTILSNLNTDSAINRNATPIVYRQQLQYWLSYFHEKYRLMTILACMIALFVFSEGSIPSKTMFLTGFSASGLQILLLFGWQIFFGNIYLLTSFVFTAFMIGLAAGSFMGQSKKSLPLKKHLSHTQLLIGAVSIGSGAVLFTPGISELPTGLIYSLYLMSSALTGGMTGFQFSQVSLFRRGNYGEISGKTYSYDLFGSAFGALAIVLLLVPELGIVNSALTIGSLNLVFGILLILIKTKKVDTT